MRAQGTDYTSLINEHGSVPGPLHQTTWATNVVIDFVKEERDAPWLFSLNIFAPHSLGGIIYPPKNCANRFKFDELPGPYFCNSDLEVKNDCKGLNFKPN
ncbi:MAG: hypothetical protein CMI18_00480 [Opitutaceae bacterium]|nr:hypothetical protein [Opitutaceae bacterium]